MNRSDREPMPRGGDTAGTAVSGAVRNSAKTRAMLAAAFLVVLVAVTYHDALDNGFHFDDRYSIVEHAPAHLRAWSFAGLYRAAVAAHHARRPLPSLTFALDWWRGGGSPRPFQMTNIAIHMVNAVLVMALIFTALTRGAARGHGPALVAALLAAALWAVHPIQTQGVTYIVQRMTSLAAMFMLLSLLGYLYGRFAADTRTRSLWFTATAVCVLAAALSKEIAWITPALLVLAEYGIVRRGGPLVRSATDVVVLGAPLVIGLACIASIALGTGPLHDVVTSGYGLRNFSLVERLLTQPRVIAFYFSEVFWPLPGRFSLEHDFPVSAGLLTPPATLAAVLGVVAWIAAGCALLSAPARRLLGFFVLWVPVCLVIESSVVPLEMVYEHRMYVPLFGIAGIVATGLAPLLGAGPRRAGTAAGITALAVAALVVATQRQLPVWRDELALVQNSLAHAPRSARAWSNLGRHYINIGRFDLAEFPLRQALAIDPRNAGSLEALGVILTNQGHLAEAETIFLRAYAQGGVGHTWLVNMGVLELLKGDHGIAPPRAYRRAAEFFRQAQAMMPDAPEHRRNLAIAYAKTGQCDQARREWRHYFDLEPDPGQRARARDFEREDFEAKGGVCAR